MYKPVLGIIGGGQLGSMLAMAAKKLEVKIIIFCDDINAPAQKYSNEFICGKYDDSKKINQFIEKVDIITFEFENIPYETLNKINKIKPVIPKPQINQIVQHRIKEKDFIAICDVGAYGMSLSSNYNLRPKPVELLIKGRTIKIIKNRQKHADLI